MSEYEIRDLVRYLHNVKKKDGSANPIIGEDELEDIGPETVYFMVTILNKLNLDSIRNNILLKVLPLKV